VREQAQAIGGLDARYGRTRKTNGRSWWLAGTVIALAAIGVAWYVWAGPASAPPADTSVQADVSASNVTDAHHIGVTFTVSAPAHREVACAVNAKSEDFTIVGWKVVVIPPSDKQSHTLTEQLRTTSVSTAGFVDSCWLT